ncbi:MAG: Gfo/Idh/MocA family oxidoreductase [Opitutaceae bacterium]|jgi:predicted dehydrogenase|nr:Gfo/Idh/MocA family oxidoreductase [Opitutaceae bacterium]
MPSPTGSRLPRVALIGVSGYGSIYLQLVRAALRAGTMRLVAAVIINKDQVPDIVTELRAGGTTIYGSSDEFFARESGKVDLCLIPTGIQWHARLTIAALGAGMNVLVEKPLAGSLADCQAIRRAEVAAGRWVAVGFQDIYAIEAQWLKAQLQAGVIGRLQEVRMVGLWPRSRAYFARTSWAGRLAADGAAVLDSPLNNAFAHFINLSLYFAGPTLGASASVTLESAELLRAHRIEMFDTAVVRGVSPEGVRFWFGVSHTIADNRQPEIYLHGSTGRAEWWHEQRCVVLDTDGRRQVFPLPDTEEFRRIMFHNVLNRLSDPSAFICTTAIAEQHTRLVEDVQHTGHVQDVPASLIDWMPDAHTRTEIPVVHGLANAIGRAAQTGSTLASVASYAEAQLVTP